MQVYIANFGLQNVHWPICLEENVLTLQTSDDLFQHWQRGDRDGWLDWATANERTILGIRPTRPVASRWYNLITLFYETAGDTWIHRQGADLFWTESLAQPAHEAPIADPFGTARPFVLLRKACTGWRNTDMTGRPLHWAGLHSKAHDFLQTEATYQALSNERGYRDYALALIAGSSRARWESLPEWSGRSRRQPVKFATTLEKTIYDAVLRIQDTVATADGRTVERTNKVKLFPGGEEQMRHHLLTLYRVQEGLCALTGIPMALNGDGEDADYRLSVDRIDSNGHYTPENVQLVCRFVNFWKQNADDTRFRQLLARVREVDA